MLRERLRTWARRIKRDGLTLWFAYRHPQTPWLVKGLCMFIVAYALSPIDFIPDFIPILGYLDDVILLPGLIWLAIRLLPDFVVNESRIKADEWVAQQRRKPRSYGGAVLVIAIWVGLLALCWYWFNRYISN